MGAGRIATNQRAGVDHARRPVVRWPLICIGIAAIVALPRATGEAGFGPWHFAVTAVGARDFREAYSFQSRHACEDARNSMMQGVTRVVAEQGGTKVGGLARRLRFSLCQAVRRGQ